MLLTTSDNTLYVIELTVGHEKQKYSNLVKELKDDYRSVSFVNISRVAYANESISLLKMLDKIGFERKHQDFCVKRMTTIPNNLLYIEETTNGKTQLF